jgi:cyanophycinase
MIGLLFACQPPHPAVLPSDDATIDGATDDDAADRSLAIDPAALSLGRVVAIGGGSEGRIGDDTAWSADVYRAMLVHGDVTGDGLVRVAVVATSEQTRWVPEYFESFGADQAFNLNVDSRQKANARDLDDRLEDVDVIFLKGGDQGEYYDKWRGTKLSDAIQNVYDLGGCIAGTSAGAMSVSEWALAGAGDFESDKILSDAFTPELDDVTRGGSAVHHDFLGLVRGTLIDSHFSTRARLGRLAGAMARVMAENVAPKLIGVGIDEQTAIVVDGRHAAVMGRGSVTFLRRGDEDAIRTPGLPLVWADLRLDRLTDGWSYDLETQSPIDSKVGEAVTWDGVLDPQSSGPWAVAGDRRPQENRFGSVAERWPNAYAVREGTAPVRLENAIGLLDAHSDYLHGVDDEVAFRALYDQLGTTVFLVGATGSLSRDKDTISLGPNAGGAMATMVLDASQVTARSLSPYVSIEDAGDGGLQAAGLVGVRLDILFTGTDGRVYDPALRRPVIP